MLKISTKKKECKLCNSRRSLKCHYEIEENLSNQQKNILKKRKKLLQKQNDRFIQFNELLRSYVELENKLKAIKKNSK